MALLANRGVNDVLERVPRCAEMVVRLMGHAAVLRRLRCHLD